MFKKYRCWYCRGKISTNEHMIDLSKDDKYHPFKGLDISKQPYWVHEHCYKLRVLLDCVERLALEMEDKYIKKDAVEELIDSKIKSEW